MSDCNVAHDISLFSVKTLQPFALAPVDTQQIYKPCGVYDVALRARIEFILSAYPHKIF